MKTEDLNYDLPAELIAQQPAPSRSGSRLLVMDRPTGKLRDRSFTDIAEYLHPGDCLVLNNTKVVPAKFFARRETGARLEGLFLEETSPGCWQVMLKNARRIKEGQTIILCDRHGKDRIEAKASKLTEPGRWLLQVDTPETSEHILTEIGFAPLPPYIKRQDQRGLTEADLDRYQTIYARQSGAVAAPTAGLHFTGELLTDLQASDVDLAWVTLHVGAGTFRPVTAENLGDHQMEAERFSLSAKDADIINNCKDAGSRIIAVGSTSVRTLESIVAGGRVEPTEGATDLFIQPGYKFGIVDAMVTNFHLPKSTLLALVAALAGLDNTLAAYQHAVEQRYRFYSYGDAMLII